MRRLLLVALSCSVAIAQECPLGGPDTPRNSGPVTPDGKRRTLILMRPDLTIVHTMSPRASVSKLYAQFKRVVKLDAAERKHYELTPR